MQLSILQRALAQPLAWGVSALSEMFGPAHAAGDHAFAAPLVDQQERDIVVTQCVVQTGDGAAANFRLVQRGGQFGAESR